LQKKKEVNEKFLKKGCKNEFTSFLTVEKVGLPQAHKRKKE